MPRSLPSRSQSPRRSQSASRSTLLIRTQILSLSQSCFNIKSLKGFTSSWTSSEPTTTLSRAGPIGQWRPSDKAPRSSSSSCYTVFTSSSSSTDRLFNMDSSGTPFLVEYCSTTICGGFTPTPGFNRLLKLSTGSQLRISSSKDRRARSQMSSNLFTVPSMNVMATITAHRRLTRKLEALGIVYSLP